LVSALPLRSCGTAGLLNWTAGDLAEAPRPERRFWQTAQELGLSAIPSEYSGKWLAWDADHKSILAAADTYPEIMAFVAQAGQPDLRVERARGLHPAVAEHPFVLLEDESPDVLDDVRKTIPDPEEWLDTPNTRLWCRKPRELIGTPQEKYLRYILRGIRSG